MANLKIKNAPLIPNDQLESSIKIPTGGKGNYSVNLGQIAQFTKNSLSLAVQADVDRLFNEKADKSDTYTKLEVDERISLGQGGVYGFKTYTDFLLVKDNIPANSIVTILEEGQYQGDNVWDGQVLTPSPYDPLAQAKEYADTKLLDKADKDSVYLKSETYNNQEVYNKGEVYSKEETFNKSEVNTVLSDTKISIENSIDEEIIQKGAALPFDETVDYVEGAFTVKEGSLQQFIGGVWKKPTQTADQIFDESGKTQQELNNYVLNPVLRTPYFRTIFEFMPKSVIDDVFGAKTLDHAPYLQAALDAVGVGGRLWIPLTASAYINIGQTVQITANHKSIHIIGSRGTASRGSSYTTFRHFGDTNHDMFNQYRTWGVTFEDCSFDGLDKSNRLMTLIAETGSDPARVMHRFNFIRCGFDAAKDKLIQIGDGGNEDIAEVNFESCHFASISATEPLASAGIYIDAPQGYSINFNTCFFIRNVNMSRMFHIRSGNVTMSAVTFDGNANGVDIYLEPYAGALMPQLNVTNGESQSGVFLDTVNGAGLFPDRNVVLINVRHRADNGQESPVSVNWDLGFQSQLIHIGCNFHCINVGANATSVVELAPTWTRRGGSLYNVTGYTGNTSVVTGLNGYNITEANRTIKGGMRVGDNFLSVCPSNTNNDPSLFTGNKIDGDFWINNKGDLTKALPNLYRYQADGTKIAISDSAVYAKYTRTVVANASKYNYILDFPIVPQLGAIYEVRWNINADNTNVIYESGVMHVSLVRKGSNIYVRKQDVSLFQETTPIITTAAAMRLTSSGAESSSASGGQAALDLFTLRIKFLNALDNLADGASLKCSIRRINY